MTRPLCIELSGVFIWKTGFAFGYAISPYFTGQSAILANETKIKEDES